LQEQVDKNKDVKLGYGLRGGGAKGLAHISVLLKVIEEAGVKNRLYSGHQMGAIIGATVCFRIFRQELDSIFKSTDSLNIDQDQCA